MTRSYLPDSQDVSLARIAEQLERIADTADDYVDITLAGTLALKSASALEPEVEQAMKPLLDALWVIQQRRENR